MPQNKEKARAFIRWAGSKRQLIPVLKEFWKPEFKRYFEPFMGSAQLFFSIDDAQEYIISDRNHELVETYLQIKKHPYSVYKILKSYKNSKEDYYTIRALNPLKLGINQRAARFLYLNWLCFNGLYRTNGSGSFNVPYSGNDKLKIDNWAIIKQASIKLNRAKICEGDFDEIVRKHVKKGDFIYLDPPYAVENQRIFNQYGNHTFGLNDLVRVSELLDFINKKGAFFLLSYAYCEEAFVMFEKWNYQTLSVQRNIAGFAKFRRKSEELLVTNIDQ